MTNSLKAFLIALALPALWSANLCCNSATKAQTRARAKEQPSYADVQNAEYRWYLEQNQWQKPCREAYAGLAPLWDQLEKFEPSKMADPSKMDEVMEKVKLSGANLEGALNESSNSSAGFEVLRQASGTIAEYQNAYDLARMPWTFQSKPGDRVRALFWIRDAWVQAWEKENGKKATSVVYQQMYDRVLGMKDAEFQSKLKAVDQLKDVWKTAKQERAKLEAALNQPSYYPPHLDMNYVRQAQKEGKLPYPPP